MSITHEELLKKLKEAGFEIPPVVRIIKTPEMREVEIAIAKFIKAVEKAHRDSANSTVHFP